MLSKKKLYRAVFLFFLLQQVARSDTSSTQQITSTSCQGYLAFATSTQTSSSRVIIPATPLAVVVRNPPLRHSPPANVPLYAQRRNVLTTCPSPVQHCLTQEQVWPQPASMYEDHRAVMGFLICIPFCWPIMVGILLYDQYCNPPFSEDSLELPACCQPQPGITFPQTALGALARSLSQHLNRSLRYSDILVLWLNHLFGTADMASLQHYNGLSAPPDRALSVAVVEGITTVIPVTAITSVQLNTTLQEVLQHLVSFQIVPPESVNHPYTDIISILIFPVANNQVIAIQQSNNSTSWMIIPQLQTWGNEHSGGRIRLIRHHLQDVIESARYPGQPVVIIRLFIQR